MNDTELPKCNEIKVFANNKRDNTASGWVTNRDRSEIDPKSISEGFVGDYLKGEILPGDFQGALERTSAAVEAESEAVIAESQTAQEETLNSANEIKERIPPRKTRKIVRMLPKTVLTLQVKVVKRHLKEQKERD